MPVKGLKRKFFQRLFGICVTRRPVDPECWTYSSGTAVLTVASAAELSAKGGAIRLEGKGLPMRVLVFRDDDSVLRAYKNKCGHKGRRVDPVPGERCVQCCSVNAAAYDYTGTRLQGPGKKPLVPLTAKEQDGKLVISIS